MGPAGAWSPGNMATESSAVAALFVVRRRVEQREERKAREAGPGCRSQGRWPV
uniref:Uncharacterized protein n=1 Tax=Arundo donax TaxID=35708 RepID=A0A0A8ZV27_ARUDO